MRNDPMIPMKINDCEIVCVSRNQRQFAERIEQRLKVIGMKVDVLFPNPKVDLNKIMGNIASRGVMFALLITPLNEDHNSVTLNVLQVSNFKFVSFHVYILTSKSYFRASSKSIVICH